MIQFDHRGPSRGFTKLSLRSTHVAAEVDDKQTSASPPGTSLHVGSAPALFADYPRSVPGGPAVERHWGALSSGRESLGLSQPGSLRSLGPRVLSQTKPHGVSVPLDLRRRGDRESQRLACSRLMCQVARCLARLTRVNSRSHHEGKLFWGFPASSLLCGDAVLSAGHLNRGGRCSSHPTSHSYEVQVSLVAVMVPKECREQAVWNRLRPQQAADACKRRDLVWS